MNRLGAQANHKSGNRGAYYFRHLGKWQVRVRHQGTYYYFGYHDTTEAAEYAATQGRERLMSGEIIAKIAYQGRTPQQYIKILLTAISVSD